MLMTWGSGAFKFKRWSPIPLCTYAFELFLLIVIPIIMLFILVCFILIPNSGWGFLFM